MNLKPHKILLPCAMIGLLCAGCAINTGVPDPFCVIGPPPVELIPDPGEPHGWIDDFLAVYNVTC